MTTDVPTTEWARGQVKWFDCRKGFGFVLDGQGQDVFVHFSVIEGDGFRQLREGETVEYLPAQGQKETQASRVRRIAER